MTQTQECLVIPQTEAYSVEPKTGEIILPPRSDVRPEDLPPPDDIFFYGWRFVEHRVNGTTARARMPLTLEDVIHPQLGDYVLQNRRHAIICKELFNGLERHVGDEPGTVILHDVGIDWGIPDLKVISPDLAMIRGALSEWYDGVFYLKDSQGSVVLVIEVTSPNTWKADVDGERDPNKMQLYAVAGVLWYIIIHEKMRKKGFPPPILVHRLGEEGYDLQDPDEQGRVWIDPLELWLGPYDEWVAWYDKHNVRLGMYKEEFEAHRREAEARKLAEDKVRDEAEARKLAEDKVRQAEERIRELEALLAATQKS